MSQQRLIYAIETDNLAEVQRILQTGLPVEYPHEIKSFVICAVKNRHIEIIRALIEANAPIHQKDQYGRTAMYYAIMYNDNDIIQCLIDAGVYSGYSDRDLHILFDDALSFENFEIARLLLKQGVSVNRIDHTTGETSLSKAIKLGNAKAFQFLLEVKASVNDSFINNRSCLQYALEQGNFDIAQLLIDAGHSLNVRGSWGRTLLSELIMNGRFEATKFLIEAKASLDKPDLYGDITPLSRAIETGQTELLQFLLNMKVSLEPIRGRKISPLHIAVEKQNLEVIQLLLENRAPLESCNRNGETLLYQAIVLRHFEITKLLLKKGAWLLSCNSWGQSPWSLLWRNQQKEDDEMRELVLTFTSSRNWNWRPEVHHLASKSSRSFIFTIMMISSQRASFYFDGVPYEILFHIFNFLV